MLKSQSDNMLKSQSDHILKSRSNHILKSQSDHILKSQSDTNEYKLYILENKLEVMLIYDKNTTRSAVSMSVGVGCYQDPIDPNDFSGLSHFLEHMLFLGTKKYPDEEEFTNYINRYGGIHNAFTKNGETNYYYELNSDYLLGSLDIFSHFFIDPLFEKSAVDRELNAVNSEFSKNLQSDSYRKMNIIRELLNKKNNMHKFCGGNLETLHKDTIYEELLKFHDKWYSANIMKLVIMHNEKPEQIFSIIQKLFGKIRNTNVAIPLDETVPLSQNIKIYTIPNNDIEMLDLVWFIDSKNDKYMSSCLYFVSYILNYKGENSLSHILSNDNVIHDYVCHFTKDKNTRYYDFRISIMLKDSGKKLGITQLVQIFMQFIKNIKNTNVSLLKRNFTILNNIIKLDIMFKPKTTPINTVSNISSNMQEFPNECSKYLVGDIIMHKFDINRIHYMMDQLADIKVIIISSKILFEKKSANQKIHIEQYCKTPYCVRKANIIYNNNDYYKENRYLYSGKYLPNNRTVDIRSNKANSDIVNIFTNRQFECWFKYDVQFKQPIICMMVYLVYPEAYSNAKNNLCNILLVGIINEILRYKLFEAYSIGYNCDIDSVFNGIKIVVSGFSDKFESFMFDIINEIININITENVFRKIVDITALSFITMKYKSSLQQCMDNAHKILISNYITYKKLSKAIETVTLNDIIDYRNNFFNNVYFKKLIFGNILKNDAIKLISAFIEKIHNKIKINNDFVMPKYDVINLTNNVAIYERKSTDINENDSAILSMFQICDRFMFDDKLAAALFNNIINDKFYNQLRTKEQLGYLVGTTTWILHNTVYLAFYIQSSVKNPDYLQQRIELFIDKFENVLHRMTDDQFNIYVESFIKIINIKNNNVYAEFNMFASEISSNQYLFNRATIETLYLYKFNKTKIIEFYNKYIKKNNRKNIIIHVHGKSSQSNK